MNDRTVLLALAAICLALSCVAPKPRYTYRPQTSEGVECKSHCTSMYSVCREEVLDDCDGFDGERCDSNSVGATSGINQCRHEEAQCLHVCEREHGASRL